MGSGIGVPGNVVGAGVSVGTGEEEGVGVDTGVEDGVGVGVVV